MNKKAIFNHLVTIFTFIGVIIIIVFGYAIWSLFAPIASSTVNTATGLIVEAGQGDDNLSMAINNSIVPFNAGLQQNIEWITYSILVFVLIGFLFTAYFVRVYPFLIIFWILAMILMVIASIYIGHTYSELRGGELAEQYQAWTVNDYILQYYPHITIFLATITSIILFMLATKDPEAESVI